MKHTKEPWRIEDRWNILSGERLVSNCGGFSSNVKPVAEENEANAKRIIACVNALEGLNPEGIKDIADQILRQFSDWADERIGDYRDMPFLSQSGQHIARIETLLFAKANLKRIIREVLND